MLTETLEGEAERAAYLHGLEAADQFDWQALIDVWNERLATPPDD